MSLPMNGAGSTLFPTSLLVPTPGSSPYATPAFSTSSSCVMPPPVPATTTSDPTTPARTEATSSAVTSAIDSAVPSSALPREFPLDEVWKAVEWRLSIIRPYGDCEEEARCPARKTTDAFAGIATSLPSAGGGPIRSDFPP